MSQHCGGGGDDGTRSDDEDDCSADDLCVVSPTPHPRKHDSQWRRHTMPARWRAHAATTTHWAAPSPTRVLVVLASHSGDDNDDSAHAFAPRARSPSNSAVWQQLLGRARISFADAASASAADDIADDDIVPW